MTFVLVTCLALFADQLSKGLVRLFSPEGNVHHVIGNFLVIRQARNPGAAFGILAGAQWFFMTVSALVVVVIVAVYLLWVRKKAVLYHVGLGLICAGALGNIIDRAVFGKVIDFIEFSFWPSFNFADAAIVAGVVIILYQLLREYGMEKQSESQGE